MCVQYDEGHQHIAVDIICNDQVNLTYFPVNEAEEKFNFLNIYE